MLFYEWSLVSFTLLAQMAVGIILVGECLLARTTDSAQRLSIRRQSLVSLVLLSLGALLSLGHTGNPVNAYNTILNILYSWLSREIVMVGLTGLALLYLAWLRIRPQEHPSERRVALVAVLCGFVLIAVMGQVYRLPVAPAWNNYSGTLLFFASALVLGAFWFGFVFSLWRTEQTGGQFSGSKDRIVPVILFAVAGFALVAISLPLALSGQGAVVNEGTANIPALCLVWSLVLRIALLALALMLFLWLMLRSAMYGKSLMSLGMGFVFLLAFAAEFFGRTLFYLSYARIGL